MYICIYVHVYICISDRSDRLYTLLEAANYANPKLDGKVHLLAYAPDRLLISDRSLVIPFRNSACGGNVRQKETKVPFDRQEGELKGEIDGRKSFSLDCPLKTRRRRNCFSRRHCRGSFIVPRTILLFRNSLSIERKKEKELDASSIKKILCFERTTKFCERDRIASFPSLMRILPSDSVFNVLKISYLLFQISFRRLSDLLQSR